MSDTETEGWRADMGDEMDANSDRPTVESIKGAEWGSVEITGWGSVTEVDGRITCVLSDGPERPAPFTFPREEQPPASWWRRLRRAKPVAT